MKRHKILLLLVVVFLACATVQAQSTTGSPQEQVQQQYRIKIQQYETELQSRRLQLALTEEQAQAQQRGGARIAAPVESRFMTYSYAAPYPLGAWWTNTATVERLGLTDDQKAKIEKAFESHRPDLASKTALLQKEESQLAVLLAAETLDRNAVLSQIDRVIQARGELERTNSAMTLEMREILTRAQWTLLPQVPAITGFFTRDGGVITPRSTTPPAAGGGARGQRGRP